MQHPIHRVTAFERVGEHSLRLRFEDDTEREIDFSPILRGEMYGPLRDPDVFGRVELDDEVGTLVWPNGADLDRATLDQWHRFGAELAERACSWPESDVVDPDV